MAGRQHQEQVPQNTNGYKKRAETLIQRIKFALGSGGAEPRFLPEFRVNDEIFNKIKLANKRFSEGLISNACLLLDQADAHLNNSLAAYARSLSKKYGEIVQEMRQNNWPKDIVMQVESVVTQLQAVVSPEKKSGDYFDLRTASNLCWAAHNAIQHAKDLRQQLKANQDKLNEERAQHRREEIANAVNAELESIISASDPSGNNLIQA